MNLKFNNKKILKERTKEGLLGMINSNKKNGWVAASDIKCDYSFSPSFPYQVLLEKVN